MKVYCLIKMKWNGIYLQKVERVKVFKERDKTIELKDVLRKESPLALFTVVESETD